MKINDLLQETKCHRVDRCLSGSDCGHEWVRLMIRLGEGDENANGRIRDKTILLAFLVYV